jgi:hypothetical protein
MSALQVSYVLFNAFHAQIYGKCFHVLVFANIPEWIKHIHAYRHSNSTENICTLTYTWTSSRCLRTWKMHTHAHTYIHIHAEADSTNLRKSGPIWRSSGSMPRTGEHSECESAWVACSLVTCTWHVCMCVCMYVCMSDCESNCVVTYTWRVCMHVSMYLYMYVWMRLLIHFRDLQGTYVRYACIYL